MAFNRTERLVVATVGTSASEDQVANDLLLEIVPGVIELVGANGTRSCRIGDHVSKSPLLHLVHCIGAIVLAGNAAGFPHRVIELPFQLLVNLIRLQRFKRILDRPDAVVEVLHQVNNLANHRVRVLNRLEHLLVGQFSREAFDHGDRSPGTGDNQVEFARLQLLVGRERNELAVNQANPNRGHRLFKRERRDEQGRRRSVHRNHIAVRLPITRQNGALHLYFVHESGCKHRPDRPVDQPRRQGFLRGRTPLALDETTGEFSRRCGPFTVITSQGKKVGPRPRRSAGHGIQDHRIPKLANDAGSGLLGQPTRLKRQYTITNLLFYANLRHALILHS